jgi:DNA-binding MarR family transcriptional regulator
MLKLDFTIQELDLIKSKIRFTPRQLRIMEYRQDELTLVQMAMKENCDVSTISREIKKIGKKIMKVSGL